VIGGRAATDAVIPGRCIVSVGNPNKPLPPGWAWARLSELAELGTGHTPSRKHPEYWTGDIPWIGIRDAGQHHGGVIMDTVQHVNELGLANSAARLLPENTVCLSRTASVGYVVIMGRPMATSQDFVTWSCGNLLDPQYLMHALLAEGEEIKRFGEGSTHTTIYFPEVKAFYIGLPPMGEQHQIVRRIKRLSGKSKRARDQLDHISRLVERYKQTILAAAFRGDLTLEWRTLKKQQFNYSITEISGLSKVVTGSTPPTKGKAKFFGGNIPFFKPTDLDAGYHVLDAREFLTEEGAAVSRPLPQSTVLVTCIGATIGKTGFARVGCCTNQQINGLVPDLALVMPEWLYWMVVSPEFQQSILDNASATTLPIINKGRFEKLSLPRPPLEEQREIVSRIEKNFAWIDRLSTEATSARKLIDHLDQAILAKAFRGELVPQDPNDEPASVLLERIRAERAAAPAQAKRGLKQSRKRAGPAKQAG
jgi:restriction endonuclease S subunit